MQQSRGYSIVSSAVASSVAGTARPSALAVLRLIASSNLVGACTGRSPGLVPLVVHTFVRQEFRGDSWWHQVVEVRPLHDLAEFVRGTRLPIDH